MSWVQYPRIRRVGARTPFFKHQAPWYLRMALVVVGGSTLAACAIALFFLGLLAWAAITA